MITADAFCYGALKIIVVWVVGTIPSAALFGLFKEKLGWKYLYRDTLWAWPISLPHCLIIRQVESLHDWIFGNMPTYQEIQRKLNRRRMELSLPPEDSLEKQFEAMK